MFKVGDIVQIHYHRLDGLAMPGSPVLNLDGTIAEVIEVVKRYNGLHYKLEFIDVKAVNIKRFKKSQAFLTWKDEHLLFISHPEYKEIDPMELFE